jgi:hypothetical protein
MDCRRNFRTVFDRDGPDSKSEHAASKFSIQRQIYKKKIHAVVLGLQRAGTTSKSSAILLSGLRSFIALCEPRLDPRIYKETKILGLLRYLVKKATSKSLVEHEFTDAGTDKAWLPTPSSLAEVISLTSKPENGISRNVGPEELAQSIKRVYAAGRMGPFRSQRSRIFESIRRVHEKCIAESGKLLRMQEYPDAIIAQLRQLVPKVDPKTNIKINLPIRDGIKPFVETLLTEGRIFQDDAGRSISLSTPLARPIQLSKEFEVSLDHLVVKYWFTQGGTLRYDDVSLFASLLFGTSPLDLEKLNNALEAMMSMGFLKFSDQCYRRD